MESSSSYKRLDRDVKFWESALNRAEARGSMASHIAFCKRVLELKRLRRAEQMLRGNYNDKR